MSEQHASIVAIVTTKPEYLSGGGAPIFKTQDHQELQKVSLTIEKIMDASAHEIDTDTIIIVAR